MARDETNTIPPPATVNVVEGSSSPATSATKSARMYSPTKEEAIGTSSSAQPDREINAAALALIISATGNTTGNDEHENLDGLEAAC